MTLSAGAVAAAIIASEQWDDPAGAVSSALNRAATRPLNSTADQAAAAQALWTHVTVALVVAADDPLITGGPVLDGLVARFGQGA